MYLVFSWGPTFVPYVLLLFHDGEVTVTQLEANVIIAYTDDEALASMEDVKLTENQYEIICVRAKAKNAYTILICVS